MRQLAFELAPLGILVNAVSPGPIDTDLTATMEPADRQAFIDALPIGRFGKPERGLEPLTSCLHGDPRGSPRESMSARGYWGFGLLGSVGATAR